MTTPAKTVTLNVEELYDKWIQNEARESYESQGEMCCAFARVALALAQPQCAPECNLPPDHEGFCSGVPCRECGSHARASATGLDAAPVQRLVKAAQETLKQCGVRSGECRTCDRKKISTVEFHSADCFVPELSAAIGAAEAYLKGRALASPQPSRPDGNCKYCDAGMEPRQDGTHRVKADDEGGYDLEKCLNVSRRGNMNTDAICKNCHAPIFDNGTVYVHRRHTFMYGKPSILETQYCEGDVAFAEPLTTPPAPASASAERRQHHNPCFGDAASGCLVCAPNSVERRDNAAPKGMTRNQYEAEAAPEPSAAPCEACTNQFTSRGAVCTCPTFATIGSEPNDSTCALSEEQHRALASAPVEAAPPRSQPEGDCSQNGAAQERVPTPAKPPAVDWEAMYKYALNGKEEAMALTQQVLAAAKEAGLVLVKVGNDRYEFLHCTCPNSTWVGSEPNDSTCALSEEQHRELEKRASASVEPPTPPHRCTLTGNPCGSDTVRTGQTCPDPNNDYQCKPAAPPASPQAASEVPPRPDISQPTEACRQVVREWLQYTNSNYKRYGHDALMQWGGGDAEFWIALLLTRERSRWLEEIKKLRAECVRHNYYHLGSRLDVLDTLTELIAWYGDPVKYPWSRAGKNSKRA